MTRKNLLEWTGAALIPVILILLTVISITTDKEFYLNEFNQHNILSKFYNPFVPLESLEQVITCFNSESTELPEISAYSHDERSHIRDVKLLLRRALLILEVSVFIESFILTVLLVTGTSLSSLSRITKSGGILTLLVLAVLSLSLISFDYFFIKFHQVFFPQGNWAFPPDSVMIRMFPRGLFVDGFVRCVTVTFILALILIIIGQVMMITKSGAEK